MSRATTISGLALTLILVLAYIALGILLKFSGYPNDPAVRFNPVAVGLRTHGLWSLILPILYVICVTFAVDEDRWITPARVGFALLTIVAIVLLFLYLDAFVNPYTRPLLQYIGRPSMSR